VQGSELCALAYRLLDVLVDHCRSGEALAAVHYAVAHCRYLRQALYNAAVLFADKQVGHHRNCLAVIADRAGHALLIVTRHLVVKVARFDSGYADPLSQAGGKHLV